MKIKELRTIDNLLLEDVLVFTPNIYKDDRGLFFESWNQNIFNNLVSQNISFVQDNHSISKKGVIRGMHYQLPISQQGKLVRCTSGKVFDAVIDIRENSSTFGKWGGEILSHENKKILWVPPGFAHGFLTLSETADIQYKVTSFWDPSSEKTIIWDDPYVNIKWPFEIFNISKPLLSLKDKKGVSIKDAKKNGDIFKA